VEEEITLSMVIFPCDLGYLIHFEFIGVQPTDETGMLMREQSNDFHGHGHTSHIEEGWFDCRDVVIKGIWCKRHPHQEVLETH